MATSKQSEYEYWRQPLQEVSDPREWSQFTTPGPAAVTISHDGKLKKLKSQLVEARREIMYLKHTTRDTASVTSEQTTPLIGLVSMYRPSINQGDVLRQVIGSSTTQLDSIYQGIAAFANFKDDKIEDLQSQLRDAKHRETVMRKMKDEWHEERSSLCDEIKRLKAQKERKGKSQWREKKPRIRMDDDFPYDHHPEVQNLSDDMDMTTIGGVHPESCTSSVSSGSPRPNEPSII